MKMKKIISLALAICILTSAALFTAGCSLFKTKIDTGTLAARLLLANERLDEVLVGGKIDVGLPTDPMAGIRSRLPSRVITTSSTVPTSDTEGAGHTWSSFPDHSLSLDEFNQFLLDVERDVTDIAEDIAHMKNNVGITDKWVQVYNELHMLRVFDTYDMLLVKDSFEDIHVYYRYTDENARNVYETYSFTSYSDGTTGETRALLIPGERYETMHHNSNGFKDYFIAENSRGYWMNTRFNYTDYYDFASFSPYIVKDGLGYGSFLTLDNGLDASLDNAWYSIFDPLNRRELFRVVDGTDNYHFQLYFDAIKEGFVSVSADNAIPDGDGIYKADDISTLTTQSGTYRAIYDHSDLPFNEFTFTGGYVQYLHGENYYYGSADFTIVNEELSIGDACVEFGEYSESIGLSLHCDMDTVATSLAHAKILADNFGDSFEWNGYKMTSIDNLKSAISVLTTQFDDARAVYEEVKDYETVASMQMLSESAHFASLAAVANGTNSFAGRTISLSGISVSCADTALFELGEEYVIKVALSLLDENGNPISVNTVPLAGTEPNGAVFEGGVITLSADGQYEIPANLDRGSYAAVIYVATKDEGIRVSELKKIAFVDIEGGEIESSAMHIEATDAEQNLVLSYEIKNTRSITVAATKDFYTYEEIERLINLEILAHGLAYRGAVLEGGDGTPIETDAELLRGSYRLMCYLPTGDGLAQSYIYLVLE